MARTRLYLMLHIILAAVYLPVLFAIVDRGPVAGAVAYLIGRVVIMPVEIILVRSASGIRLISDVKSLLGPLLATTISTGAIMLVLRGVAELHPLIQLAAGGSVGVVVYIVVLALATPAVIARCRDVVRAAVGKNVS